MFNELEVHWMLKIMQMTCFWNKLKNVSSLFHDCKQFNRIMNNCETYMPYT